MANAATGGRRHSDPWKQTIAMPLYTLALRFRPPGIDEQRLAHAIAPTSTRLTSEGKLVAAGPWGHDDGALIVYQADDADEARKLLDNDPYAAEGVLADAELHEWRPVAGNASALT